MAMHDKRYRTYQVSLEEPLNKQNGKEGQDDLRIAQFSTKIEEMSPVDLVVRIIKINSSER